MTTKRLVHVRAAALLALALSTTACLPPLGPGEDMSPTPEPAAAPSPEREEPEADGGASTDASPPADQADPGRAAWGVPTPAPGWETVVFDENGIHQFRHETSSCQVTLQQNAAENAEGATGYPDDTIDGWVGVLEAEVGEVGVTEEPYVAVEDASGDTALFRTVALDYTGVDGEDYALRLSARWFADVEMIIASSCRAAEFTDRAGDLDAFVGLLSVQRI